MTSERVTVKYSPSEAAVADLDAKVWETAERIDASQYWSGRPAPEGRRFSVKLFWSDAAFYVRFAAEQAEPIIAAAAPVTDRKTEGLWDRDVCEIFIAPDRREPRKYFEFEAAPTGESVDIAIDLTGEERLSDLTYVSGMETASRIEPGRVITAIKIPFTAFGNAPKPGDIWLCNIFRCVGKDPNRGYVAWRPTFTEIPNFHVPEVFAEIRFGV